MKRSFAYAAQEAQHRIQDHGELFDICAKKHGGNPESAEAHKAIRGSIHAQREQVYAVIKQWTNRGGITVDEYAESRRTTPNAISGRFSELARDGRIVKAGRRKTRSGCSAAVWKAL